MLMRVGSAPLNRVAFGENHSGSSRKAASSSQNNEKGDRIELKNNSLIELKELSYPKCCKTAILQEEGKAFISLNPNLKTSSKFDGLIEELKDAYGIKKITFISHNDEQDALVQKLQREHSSPELKINIAQSAQKLPTLTESPQNDVKGTLA